MAKIAAWLVAALSCLVACSPGPLPDVPPLVRDYQSDRFPSRSDHPWPLDEAILADRIDQVRALLAAGADPNARWGHRGDHHPLQLVLDPGTYVRSQPTETVRLLLAHGADPNARWCPFESRGDPQGCTSAQGMTPLLMATLEGRTGIVEMLLAAEADPRMREWGGASALDYAYDEVVFELISRVQFPNLATRDQKAFAWLSNSLGSPFDSRWPATSMARALRGSEGAYIPPPPPPPPPGPDGRSSLPWRDHTWEAQGRIASRVNTLLRIGANPNQRVTQGKVDWTPLAMALQARQFRAARALLANAADVNQRWCFPVESWRPFVDDPACTTDNGSTPLMWSAARGDDTAVKVLLSDAADRTLTDWDGRTALDYATTPAVKTLLTAAGAKAGTP